MSDLSDIFERAEADVPVTPGAGAPRLHWLLRAARELGLEGVTALALPHSMPVADVWRQICAAAGLSAEDFAGLISDHLRIPLADGAELERPDYSELTRQLAERYGVLPLWCEGRTLAVATADPMNADAEQALSFACKRRIVFHLATPGALGLDQPQADEAELEELLRSAGDSPGTVWIEEEAEARDVGADDISAEPVIRLANLILREAIRQGASDVHLGPDQGRGSVRFRVDGILRPYMQVPMTALHRVISRFKVVARLDIADRVRPQDGRISIRVEGEPYELRLSTVPTQDAEKAVIRIAGSVQEQSLEQLGIPAHELERLGELLSFRDGIIVVTGPTGSGKTTTLYGALNALNTGDVNIMTVEDPIERALPGITQIQVQPKRGVTFASALRAILRQDPDIILLGEIRDLETAHIAVQAATTGHLVLTTLHTTSAVGVVARLRDLGLESSSLSGTLRGVVAQRLVRRICARCGGSGCEHCSGTGLRGRLPLMEVLTASPLFTELVGRGALFHDLQQVAEEDGMRPMRVVAAEAVASGATTPEEVARVVGELETEARLHATFGGGAPRIDGETRHALGDGAADADGGAPNGVASLPGVTGLPARLADVPDPDAPARRRLEVIRGLLQGLDRCVADGLPVADVLSFACEQLTSAFDSPLVWIATLEKGAPEIRARAGSCAPYVRDLVPDWSGLDAPESAIGTALRTCAPQGRRLDDEPGFEGWQEHARAHGLPLFIVVPILCEGLPIGVIGMHARSMAGLDRQAGNELLNVSDRLGEVIHRLTQLEAAGLQLSALELAADAVFMTDRRGFIQWVNRSFVQLTGYAAVDAIGQSPRILGSGQHDAALFADLWNTILSGRSWRGELCNRRPDGTTYTVDQTITPVLGAGGGFTHFLCVQRDITDRKEREESVRQLVTRDALTGLPNGRALDVEIARESAAVAKGGTEGALLLIHVDGGAALREAAGPEAAESLVRTVADVLGATLRPGDFLARLDDYEFAAVLPDTPRDGAVTAAARLRTAVARQQAPPDAPVQGLSVSIGIAPVDGTQSARGVLAVADAALYGQTDAGDSALPAPASATAALTQASSEWAERIRSALRDDHFCLHFQPVVRLGNRTVAHYDALLRLHDEDGEEIPARIFIGHAEDLGLMPQIDRWVVENVLRLLQTAPDLRVSLNLSASTVLDNAFRLFLQRQSRRMAAVGARMIFEVAEVEAVAQLPRMIDHMERLRELGCRFALDNFGIGRGSLASLGSLPVDYVKLDGSLVAGIDCDTGRQDIVRALTTIARALGREVIAGWAERAAIVELLPSLGVELAQGHYLGRPSPELQRQPTAGDEPPANSADPVLVFPFSDRRPRIAI